MTILLMGEPGFYFKIKVDALSFLVHGDRAT